MIFPFFGHEVYVLTPEQINQLWPEPLNVWQVLSAPHNRTIILLGSSVGLLAFGLALFIKSRDFAKRFGRLIDKSTIIAPDVIRIAFGLALILSGMEKALFGPELPLSLFPLAAVLKPLLIVLGGLLILGIANRLMAAVSIGVYLLAFVDQGWYMLNYINYLGEAIAVYLLPNQFLSVDGWWKRRQSPKYQPSIFSEKYSLPIARILFGLSLMFAAIQVKIFHPALSYQVVNQYHLTSYFPFDPLMVVLGAALVEILIGVLYMLGLLNRANSVFFMTFLILSIIFFKEDVWPHYLLIGLGLGLFLHRPDRLALDSRLFKATTKKRNR